MEYFSELTLNDVNKELLNSIETPTLSDDELLAKQEKMYAQHLKNAEYCRRCREKNKEAFNEKAKIKMRAHYQNNEAYKQAQKISYYKSYYGVETLEQVNEIKKQRSREKVKAIIERASIAVRTRGRPMISFEDYIKCR